MRIKISKNDLLSRITIAQKAISTRTTMQILEGILFEAKGNCLKLTSTDLEMGIETKTECIVEKEGATVINSAMIGNIVRKLPDDVIDIHVVDQKVRIECANSLFHLMGANPSDYPNLPDPGQKTEITLYGNLLKESIRQTIFAVSQDETKQSVTGIHMDSDGGTLNVVSIDGYRLALRKIHDNIETLNITVPARSMNELTRIVEDEEEVKINVVPGHVVFLVEDTTVYSRLIEAKFIDYASILRENFSTRVVVDRGEFLSSLERASLLSREEKSNLVRLHMEDTMMTIQSNTEIGDVKEVLPIVLEGESLKIAFNARYLIDGVRVMDSPEIELNFDKSLNPCIIHPIDENMDYTYLVLPVRVAGGDE